MLSRGFTVSVNSSEPTLVSTVIVELYGIKLELDGRIDKHLWDQAVFDSKSAYDASSPFPSSHTQGTPKVYLDSTELDDARTLVIGAFGSQLCLDLERVTAEGWYRIISASSERCDPQDLAELPNAEDVLYMKKLRGRNRGSEM